MDILFARQPFEEDSRVWNGATRWLTLHEDEIPLNDNNDPEIISHLKPFCEGFDSVIQPFALWALNCVKDLLSNSLVESMFSVQEQVPRAIQRRVSGGPIGDAHRDQVHGQGLRHLDGRADAVS